MTGSESYPTEEIAFNTWMVHISSDEMQAKEYKGDPQTIIQVLRDIATFF